VHCELPHLGGPLSPYWILRGVGSVDSGPARPYRTVSGEVSVESVHRWNFGAFPILRPSLLDLALLFLLLLPEADGQRQGEPTGYRR